jgi:hypothetical protein
MNEELIQLLKDYVATANNPNYGGDWRVINSKFPELAGYDQQLLKDYVATANNPQYGGDWNSINSKFPEFKVKKKEASVSTSQEAAMEQPMETGSSELPKSEGVKVTTPTGQQATVQWGPTEFKASQDAPMYDMASLSDIVGNVDVTIDEATKQKISNVVGITGAVFNKIVNPQSNAAQALADAKKFADNTQTAYNVGALSAQISNNMADEVPDYERVAKLKQQLKNEQPKLLSSQLGAEAGDFFDMLAANPVTFLTEVLTTSATQMTGGAGAMTPEDLLYATALGLPTAGAGATAYMAGKNSLNAEMSSRILDALEERGVDVTNAEQLRTAMTNPELMMDVKSEVQAPALIVGALDAISGGLAGRFGKPLVELAIQAGAGAVGEAGAQIAADGRITAPSAILTEMVAEIPGGLIETAFGAKTKDIARKTKVNQEIKELETELSATDDPEVRGVLETALNAKRNEKNKIFTDYADFVNSLPEEEVSRLNALNEEIVKVSNAINTVTSDIAGKALRDRRQSLLDEVAKIEETATPTQDAVQEQATDEGVLRPEQPEVGLQEMVEGDQEPEVTAEAGEEVVPQAVEEQELSDLRAIIGEPDGGEPRFRLSDSETIVNEADVEGITDVMNKMPAVQLEFQEPTGVETSIVSPIEQSKSTVKDITEEQASALTGRIEDYNGLPMVTGMSDILASGVVKDSMGNDMQVDGGLLFNVLGSNKDLAWAGVNEGGAQAQYDAAVRLYQSNKPLFDKAWTDGKLPNGHVPMAIMRMSNGAINSNEAVFRWILPTVESLPEKNRVNAMTPLIEAIDAKTKVSDDKIRAAANALKSDIEANNIKSVDELLKYVIEQAKQRAAGNEDTFTLPERSLLYEVMFSAEGVKKPNSKYIKTLFDGVDATNAKNFTSDAIYDAIGEESMKSLKQGSVVAIMGIDVLNGGVQKARHNNYGFGPKGQAIAILQNPTHGIDVFPEWKAKASRVFKEKVKKTGEVVAPDMESIPTQVGGAFFADGAFIGARPMVNAIGDIEMLMGKLRFAFPSVQATATQEEFDAIMQDPEVRTREVNGMKILGLTKDGNIYINPSEASLATPIHEFGHIWIDFLRSKESGKKGTELLNKGLELVEGTQELKAAIEKYGDTELAREEALVELMATKGETIINASKRSKFKSWLNGVFKYIKERFTTSKDLKVDGIKDLTLDEFIGVALADLFSGQPINNKFSPRKAAESMRARYSAQEDNIYDIVGKARAEGFRDVTIEAFLKERGYTAEEIKGAMDIPLDVLGAVLPDAFKNLEGGAVVGQKLFNDIREKLNKLSAKKNRITKKPVYNKLQLREEAKNILTVTEEFKAQTDEVKAKLMLDLDKAIGIKSSNAAMREEFKSLRAMLLDRKKTRDNLEAIKRKVRGFIRKSLPQGEYTKADVLKLIQAVTDANYDNLPAIMQRVEGYINEYNVAKVERDINKLLETKTTKVESGRRMGTTTIQVQDALASINEELVSPDMAPDKIAETMERQLKEFDELTSEFSLDEEDIMRAQILQIAMLYNEASLMENNDPNKLDTLTQAKTQLAQLVLEGRSAFKDALSRQHDVYKQRIKDLIEAIIGKVVSEDITTNDGAEEFVRTSEIERANEEATKSRVAKAWSSFVGQPFTNYFDKTGSLHTLLSRITENLTDQFGGIVHEMVYDRLKQSSIEFEGRMQKMKAMIDKAAIDIFGEKYDSVVKNNKVKAPIDIFKDEAAAKKIMDEMKTASSKRKTELNTKLNKLRLFKTMSQNQIYYLYNQYKDPANRTGFESKFGDNYVELMDRLFNEALDPKVREWADWQVNVLYPSLYQEYNPVYQNIFRTNMPWNPNYAGRMYREFEADDTMAISLMNDNGEFSNIQTPSSTKLRKKNKNAIKLMDGDGVLSSYLGDMEYFRAYAETIRDIDKMFKNKAVRESIKRTAGEDVLKLIDNNIKLVGTRGMSAGEGMKQTMLDNISARFAKAVLMANPSQFVKQATSMFAFANRIGFENWAKYTAKAAPDMKNLWNEFIENAPRIQKRYNPNELTAIIGTYKQGRTADIMPKDKEGNPILRTAGEVYDKMLDAMMWPVIQGDKFSAMAGAMGNYLYYKESFFASNPKATEQEAIKYAADKVSTEIEQTLGSSDIIDKDYYQNSGNALYRAFSVLQNAPKAMIRQIVPAYSGFFKKLAKMDKTAGQGTLKQNIETIFLYQFLVPMLFQYAVLGFPGLLREWREDEDDYEMGMAALLGPFTALFFVGDMLTSARDLLLDKPWATDARTAPGWDILSDATKSAQKIMNAKSDDDVYEAIADMGYAASAAAGLGLKNISRMAQNMAEVIDSGANDAGEAVLRLLNYSDYTIEGPDKKKK